MSFNPNVTPTKITYEGDTLLDLTGDTVTADKLASGYTAHNSSGQAITGTMSSVTVNSLSVTENGTYTAPSGTAYSPVTVNVSGGVSGVLKANIDRNGKAIKPTTLDASNIKNIESGALYYWMAFNVNLTSVDLSNVEYVSTNGLRVAFSGCTELSSVDLSSLTNIRGNALGSAFKNCSSLTSIEFPSLTTAVSSSFGAECFSDCTALTAIHFKASAQSTIEGLTGYDSKFGATNATIYFDL